VTALFDTSVLVAALVEAHPEHSRAFPWLQQARGSEIQVVVAAHSIAEAYAVLSSLPVSPRIAPSAAWALLEHSVLPYAQAVDLSAADVRETVERLSRQGMAGGVVYDALIAAAARKGRADCIVTLNVEDFLRVVDSSRIAVRTP
jgi:predicted nucleic acid-binding protein